MTGSAPGGAEPPLLTVVLTAFTMVAFAANSILCRMALGRELIDPVSFTTVRIVSGAVVLMVLVRIMASGAPEGRSARKAGSGAPERPSVRQAGSGASAESAARKAASWASALALFAYATAFSLAYVSLEAGTGALILFGGVQATMIGAGLWRGERPRPPEWLGLALAVGGLGYLTLPGATAPDPLGSLLMLTSGVAWGVYSLRGKGVAAPILSTTGSFVRAAPLALLASVAAFSLLRIEVGGLLLAVASGAVTSGLGYALWYRALRGLTRVRAAIVQLSVPVLAAFGGVVILSERITLRLVVASLLILGGVAIAVVRRSRPVPVAVGAGEAPDRG